MVSAYKWLWYTIIPDGQCFPSNHSKCIQLCHASLVRQNPNPHVLSCVLFHSSHLSRQLKLPHLTVAILLYTKHCVSWETRQINVTVTPSETSSVFGGNFWPMFQTRLLLLGPRHRLTNVGEMFSIFSMVPLWWAWSSSGCTHTVLTCWRRESGLRRSQSCFEWSHGVSTVPAVLQFFHYPTRVTRKEMEGVVKKRKNAKTVREGVSKGQAKPISYNTPKLTPKNRNYILCKHC